MQGESIAHTLPKLQTECEMYGSLGSWALLSEVEIGVSGPCCMLSLTNPFSL